MPADRRARHGMVGGEIHHSGRADGESAQQIAANRVGKRSMHIHEANGNTTVTNRRAVGTRQNASPDESSYGWRVSPRSSMAMYSAILRSRVSARLTVWMRKAIAKRFRLDDAA